MKFVPMSRRFLLCVTLLIAALQLSGCGTTGFGNKPEASDPVVQRLMKHYRQWYGTPYRWGGNGRSGVDCSAFVQLTIDNVFDIGLPRYTKDQARQGRRVSRSRLRSGDLVFFKTGWFKYHVGVYVGNNDFIHASESKGVTRSSLNTPYWSKHYWKARRVA